MQPVAAPACHLDWAQRFERLERRPGSRRRGTRAVRLGPRSLPPAAQDRRLGGCWAGRGAGLAMPGSSHHFEETLKPAASMPQSATPYISASLRRPPSRRAPATWAAAFHASTPLNTLLLTGETCRFRIHAGWHAVWRAVMAGQHSRALYRSAPPGGSAIPHGRGFSRGIPQSLCSDFARLDICMPTPWLASAQCSLPRAVLVQYSQLKCGWAAPAFQTPAARTRRIQTVGQRAAEPSWCSRVQRVSARSSRHPQPALPRRQGDGQFVWRLGGLLVPAATRVEFRTARQLARRWRPPWRPPTAQR
jgi:hypothetical protein